MVFLSSQMQLSTVHRASTDLRKDPRHVAHSLRRATIKTIKSLQYTELPPQ